MTQCLKGQLGETFGAAHHIGGTNGLVSGDQHKVGNTRLQCRLGSIECPDHIVQHAFGDVVFHHRDMLVSCGVVDGIHAPGLHDIEKLVLMTDGTKDRQQLDRY
ncbi:hypothetical protein D3C78_1621790 [compost metagenome]